MYLKPLPCSERLAGSSCTLSARPSTTMAGRHSCPTMAAGALGSLWTLCREYQVCTAPPPRATRKLAMAALRSVPSSTARRQRQRAVSAHTHAGAHPPRTRQHAVAAHPPHEDNARCAHTCRVTHQTGHKGARAG